MAGETGALFVMVGEGSFSRADLSLKNRRVTAVALNALFFMGLAIEGGWPHRRIVEADLLTGGYGQGCAG